MERFVLRCASLAETCLRVRPDIEVWWYEPRGQFGPLFRSKGSLTLSMQRRVRACVKKDGSVCVEGWRDSEHHPCVSLFLRENVAPFSSFPVVLHHDYFRHLEDVQEAFPSVRHRFRSPPSPSKAITIQFPRSL